MRHDLYKKKKRHRAFLVGNGPKLLDTKKAKQDRRRLRQLQDLDNPLYFGNSIHRIEKDLCNAEGLPQVQLAEACEPQEELPCPVVEETPQVRKRFIAERFDIGDTLQEQPEETLKRKTRKRKDRA